MLTSDCYGTEYGENNFEVISFNKHFFASFKMFNGTGKLSGPTVPVSTNDLTPVDKKVVFSTKADNGRLKFLFRLSDTQMNFKTAQMDTKKDIAEIEVQWNDFAAKLPKVKEEHKEFAVCSLVLGQLL